MAQSLNKPAEISRILGSGKLFKIIAAHVPANKCLIQTGSTNNDKLRYLLKVSDTAGKKILFTDYPQNYQPLAKRGWIVYWCAVGRPPIGTTKMSNEILSQPVQNMVKQFWHIDVIDKRLIGDIILGRVEHLAPVLFLTSASGGVGKSTSAQRIADRASAQKIRTLLVDGNMRQSSQRSFFDPLHDKQVNTIAAWSENKSPVVAANHGRDFNVNYDIVFAPPAGVTVPWELYSQYIDRARTKWDFVIVDLDRISPADLTDDTTAGGILLAPHVLSGDSCLFIVKAGMQTQGDAVSVLRAMNGEGFPLECVGIKESVPETISQYPKIGYSKYGTFLGVEKQTANAATHIANGESNWTDSDLDYVREKTLHWVLPEAGFKPENFASKPAKKKGWFK